MLIEHVAVDIIHLYCIVWLMNVKHTLSFLCLHTPTGS